MKVNLNFKINSDVAYQLDITKDYPNEILYISKKYNLKIKDIYICNHPCGEATIFSLENGKTNKWLGYIDENFYLGKTLFEIGMTEDEYYEECKKLRASKSGHLLIVQKRSDRRSKH